MVHSTRSIIFDCEFAQRTANLHVQQPVYVEQVLLRVVQSLGLNTCRLCPYRPLVCSGCLLQCLSCAQTCVVLSSEII